MNNLSIHPIGMFSGLFAHRELTLRLIRHDIAAHNRGSLLGFMAMLLPPLLMLALYLFIFDVVFRVRIATPDNRIDFAFSVFVGMSIFSLFTECVTAAPHALRANANYVKKVVFPIEILSWVTLGSALLRLLVTILAMLTCLFLIKGQISVQFVLFPLVLAPLILYILSASWLLAAAGVFSGEVSRLTGVAISALIFLSPIFYPADAVPAPFSTLIQLNPLTSIIENSRSILLDGDLPDWTNFAMQTGIAFLAAWVGFAVFQTCRSEFSDAL